MKSELNYEEVDDFEVIDEEDLAAGGSEKNQSGLSTFRQEQVEQLSAKHIRSLLQTSIANVVQSTEKPTGHHSHSHVAFQDEVIVHEPDLDDPILSKETAHMEHLRLDND